MHAGVVRCLWLSLAMHCVCGSVSLCTVSVAQSCDALCLWLIVAMHCCVAQCVAQCVALCVLQVAEVLQQELAALDSYLELASDVRGRLSEAEPDAACTQLSLTKQLLQQAVSDGKHESVPVLVDRREVQRKATTSAMEDAVDAVTCLLYAQKAQCERIENQLPVVDAMLSAGRAAGEDYQGKSVAPRDEADILSQSVSWCSEVASTSLQERAVATDRAVAAAMSAIARELASFEQEAELLAHGEALSQQLHACGQQVMQRVLDAGDPREDLQHTDELVAHYSAVLTKLQQSDSCSNALSLMLSVSSSQSRRLSLIL